MLYILIQKERSFQLLGWCSGIYCTGSIRKENSFRFSGREVNNDLKQKAAVLVMPRPQHFPVQRSSALGVLCSQGLNWSQILLCWHTHTWVRMGMLFLLDSVVPGSKDKPLFLQFCPCVVYVNSPTDVLCCRYNRRDWFPTRAAHRCRHSHQHGSAWTWAKQKSPSPGPTN